MAETKFRLSQDILPTDYDCHFVPDIPKKTFVGHSEVTFKVFKQNPVAELHAHSSIDIKSIKQLGKALEFSREQENLYIKCDDFEKAPLSVLSTTSVVAGTTSMIIAAPRNLNRPLLACSCHVLMSHAAKPLSKFPSNPATLLFPTCQPNRSSLLTMATVSTHLPALPACPPIFLPSPSAILT